jgi:hypothetical protein
MRRSIRLAIGVVALAVVAIPVLSAQAATGLSTKERTTLQSMREEEKLAHDVYVVLASKTGDVRFSRIAAAEIRHGQALERVMAANGVADPTDGYGAGKFPTPSFQKMYDELVEQGSVSLAAALEVGRRIEREDIAGLAVAIDQTDDAVLDQVYAALKAGSTRHLAAFQTTSAGTRPGMSGAPGAGRGSAGGQRAARGNPGATIRGGSGTCPGTHHSGARPA